MKRGLVLRRLGMGTGITPVMLESDSEGSHGCFLMPETAPHFRPFRW